MVHPEGMMNFLGRVQVSGVSCQESFVDRFSVALLANANAGGDNVHRGMVLGLIVGAANDELPDHLINGLLACDELKNEIEAFADIVLNGQGI